MSRSTALSCFLPGIQQSGDAVLPVVENPPIVFAGSLDPFGHRLEEHGIQPMSDIVSKQVLLDGPGDAPQIRASSGECGFGSGGATQTTGTSSRMSAEANQPTFDAKKPVKLSDVVETTVASTASLLGSQLCHIFVAGELPPLPG
jgi:hypothetical protein